MLKRPRKAKRASVEASLQDAILNDGLVLAMEFGPNWLEPIQARLRQKYPQLSDSELDEYDSACRTAMDFGNETVASLAHETKKNPKYDDFEVRFQSRYAWASPSTMSRLFSQGMYYLWKDGGVE